MPYLLMAVALVATLCLLDLLLTFGVIRRLREHTELLSRRPGGEPTPAVGSRVGEVSATATDGTVVRPTRFAVPTMVAFFTPGCEPCAELLPRFTAFAREGTGTAPVAVVVGPEPDEYVARLAPVATVVSGEQARALADAFSVNGFPTVCVIGPDGTVVEVGQHLVTAPTLASA